MARIFPTSIVSFMKTAYPWLPNDPVPAEARNPVEVSGLLILLVRPLMNLYNYNPRTLSVTAHP
jgi:hypothetical protein